MLKKQPKNYFYFKYYFKTDTILTILLAQHMQGKSKSNMDEYENSDLLGCDAVSFGEWFQHFEGM
jgi:hypothetical protein